MIEELFVVVDVEIGFGIVFGYEDFVVLEWVYGIWVDVEVWVEFLYCDV